MKTQKGLTLLEVIVIVLIIMVLLAIFMPSLGKVKKYAQRVVCGVMLKQLGHAITEYTNRHDGCLPQLPGSGPWSKELGFDYDNPKPDFTGAQSNTPRTITASWYLLVREADMPPKCFICPESNQNEFIGRNPKNLDIIDLWDFGSNPYEHISYAMHNPFGKFPANKKLPSSFAVAADMSPWFLAGDILPKGESGKIPQVLNILNKKSYWAANSKIHDTKSNDFIIGKFRKYKVPGQNVLYVDGHNSYEKTSNVGINQDNIYTYWSKDKEPSEQDIQGGTAPTNRDPENDAKSPDDSFLAI